MDKRFEGKRFIVTGAGQGIGRDLAKKLAKNGATVIALSRTDSHLQTLKAEYPSIITVCVDLTHWDAAKEAVKGVLPVHGLVNNAAIALLDSFFDVKPDDFDKIFSANVKSIIAVSQVVGEDMVKRGKGGSIVNVSSQASQAALKDHLLYCSTKGAVDSMTRVMALELGPHGIRTNAVNPTVALTDMGRLGWSEPTKAQKMLSKIPLGRFAEVDEIVNAILFLLSDDSSMINGITLPIDGGFLAT